MRFLVSGFIVCHFFLSIGQDVPLFVRNVYETMYGSMENGSIVKPLLVFDNDSRQIVSYYPSENELKIGYEFIQICRSFGLDSSNAMAHVLGHELAHILLQQNDFVKSVGSGYASKEVNKQMKNIHKTLKDSVFERQADEYASFYAHIAGYNTVHIGEKVLDSIYAHFNLRDKDLSRYPSLQERKLICRATAKRMKVLKSLFDYANLATISGNYDIAESCYHVILKEKFPSREIFNNLSVVYLLKAIQEIDTIEFPYLFPIELDFNSRLYSQERSIFSKYEENLYEAIRYAELALGTKKEYAKAWLNKSIAEFLLKKNVDASYSLFKAKELNISTIDSNIETMEALMLHKQGDFENAFQKLKNIKNQNYIANENLKKFIPSNLLLNNETDESWFTDSLRKLSRPNFEFYYLKDNKRDTFKNELVFSKSISLNVSEDDDFIYRELTDNNKKSIPKFYFFEYKKIPFFHDELFFDRLSCFYSSESIKYYRFDTYIFQVNNKKIEKIFFLKY